MSEYITKGQAWGIASYAANTGNLEKAKKLLDVAPTAPIARCEWVESGYGTYVCSACNIEWSLDDGVPEIKYCPNCGKKLNVPR